MRDMNAAGWGMAAAAVLITWSGALAGCSGPVVTPGYVNLGSSEFASAVMDKGPLLVRVYGTPYASEPGALSRLIEQEMARALPWIGTARFTTNAEKAVGGPWYVSLIFNQGYVGASQCRDQSGAGGTPSPNGDVMVSAAFCDGVDLISTTSGSLARSTGPDDPAFAALIRLTTQALLPGRSSQPSGFGLQIGGGGIGVGF